MDERPLLGAVSGRQLEKGNQGTERRADQPRPDKAANLSVGRVDRSGTVSNFIWYITFFFRFCKLYLDLFKRNFV